MLTPPKGFAEAPDFAHSRPGNPQTGRTPMSHIAGRRVVVTGGAGFLGRAVCAALEPCRPAALLAPRKAQYDLTDQTAVRRMLDELRPDLVVHLGAVVGGIGANRENPGRYF